MDQGSSKDVRDNIQPSYVVKQHLNSQISVIDGEISSVDAEIENLKQLRENLVLERKGLLSQLKSASQVTHSPNHHDKGKQVATGVNYTESFDWTGPMMARMKSVFRIQNFRLCQEACVSRSLPECLSLWCLQGLQRQHGQ